MKKPSPIEYSDIDPLIRNNSEKGIHCPCCGQWARKYVKAIGSPIARFLIRLYLQQQKHNRFYTTRELYPRDNKASTEGVLARYWGLIEVAEVTNSGGAPVGSYRLTDMGRRFVVGSEYVPSHAHIYNGELLELSGDMRNIHTALTKKWDYNELMNGLG